MTSDNSRINDELWQNYLIKLRKRKMRSKSAGPASRESALSWEQDSEDWPRTLRLKQVSLTKKFRISCDPRLSPMPGIWSAANWQAKLSWLWKGEITPTKAIRLSKLLFPFALCALWAARSSSP